MAQQGSTEWTELNDILKGEADAQHIALIQPSSSSSPTSLSYQDLRGFIHRLQNTLPFSAITPQSVVTLLIPNSIEYVAVFFAVAGLRGVVNPLNPAYKRDELSFYLQDVQSSLVLVLEGRYDQLDQLIPVTSKLGIPVFELSSLKIDDGSRSPTCQIRQLAGPVIKPSRLTSDTLRPQPDDSVLFLHTSGTTGKPKGVPLTNRNILTNLKNIAQTYHLCSDDRSYLVMPLFHVHGLIGVLLSSLIARASVVIPPKFSASSFWSDFLTHGCTWFSAVPTIHQILLMNKTNHYPGHSGKLRFIRSCSASLAPAIWMQLERSFGSPVIEAYAMSEAAHQMTSNYLPQDGDRKPGSVGCGQGVQVCIMNDAGQPAGPGTVGEVCVAGDNVIKGYHRNEKATRESFHPDPKLPNGISVIPEYQTKKGCWFRTGDLGYLDADHFLFLIGRIKEQINRGGEKISPTEIDRCFLAMEGVAEAVAFPVPSSLWGEEIEVAVVLRPEWSKATGGEEARLLAMARRDGLALFKIPRRVHIVASLPKTATGKISRRLVAAAFAPGMTTSSLGESSPLRVGNAKL